MRSRPSIFNFMLNFTSRAITDALINSILANFARHTAIKPPMKTLALLGAILFVLPLIAIAFGYLVYIPYKTWKLIQEQGKD